MQIFQGVIYFCSEVIMIVIINTMVTKVSNLIIAQEENDPNESLDRFSVERDLPSNNSII